MGACAGVDAEAVSAAVKQARAGGDQVVSFAVLGHKADLGVMALGPDPWRLWRLEGALRASGLDLVSSYVSLTEVSEYAAGLPAEMKEHRLHPRLPPEGMPAVCFYPMSKRREAGLNWYMLPYEERRALMGGHGAVGRRFAGRVLQLITGSVGLDDYEWGVTLFGQALCDLKEVVYTMRFDPASAQYAQFGPFYTGLLAEAGEVVAGSAGQ